MVENCITLSSDVSQSGGPAHLGLYRSDKNLWEYDAPAATSDNKNGLLIERVAGLYVDEKHANRASNFSTQCEK